MSTARSLARPVKRMQAKLRNRRVMGGLMADGTFQWRFKRLGEDGGIYCGSIRLSREAMVAMFEIMAAIDRSEQ